MCLYDFLTFNAKVLMARHYTVYKQKFQFFFSWLQQFFCTNSVTLHYSSLSQAMKH